MTKKALPLLMFMVAKHIGNVKTRGVENGSVQRLHTDKLECLSPTPDYVCGVISKEDIDTATEKNPDFFCKSK